MLKYCRIAFTATTAHNKFILFQLQKDIQAFDSASNSVILSAAAYIVKEYPNLPHPALFAEKPPHLRVDAEYPSPCLSVHPLFDEWVDTLANAFVQKNACRFHQTLFLKINVCTEYADILKAANWQFQITDKQPTIHQIFKIPVPQSNKKVAWINCATGQLKLKNRVYLPKINTVAIVGGQIYNNEEYTVYNILRGQIPTAEQLVKYDTLIIPGSGLSVLDENQHIQEISKNIYQAYHMSDKLKVFGICYGHQLIAKAFGATLEKRQRAKGLQLIRFSQQVAKQFQFLAPLAKSENHNLHLSEHHQDFVTSIPKGFHLLATSKSCENEAVVSENGRIFTTQFHPQYNYPYTKGYVCRLKISSTGQQQKVIYHHSDAVLKEHIKSCELLRQCISNFI